MIFTLLAVMLCVIAHIALRALQEERHKRALQDAQDSFRRTLEDMQQKHQTEMNGMRQKHASAMEDEVTFAWRFHQSQASRIRDLEHRLFALRDPEQTIWRLKAHVAWLTTPELQRYEDMIQSLRIYISVHMNPTPIRFQIADLAIRVHMCETWIRNLKEQPIITPFVRELREIEARDVALLFTQMEGLVAQCSDLNAHIHAHKEAIRRYKENTSTIARIRDLRISRIQIVSHVAKLIEHCMDPISQELMEMPVILTCGHSIGKHSLTMLRQHRANVKCPLCRQPVWSEHQSIEFCNAVGELKVLANLLCKEDAVSEVKK